MFAAYGVAIPAPAGPAVPVNPDVSAGLVVDRPEPLFPQCFDCGNRKGPLTPCPQHRRYPNGAQVLHCAQHAHSSAPVQAAAALLDVELDRLVDSGEAVTGELLARAEEAAGLLFDRERAQAIASASYAQARAEDQAELAIAEQDRETLLWLRERWRAVGRLCEGRPDTDLVTVREVLTATDGAPPTGAPLAVTWDGPVMGPSGDTEGENTLIPATTARGGRAALVLDDEQRLMLGGLLLASLHTAGRCLTAGCGTGAEDLDASDPEVWGWVLVDVAGSEGGARWWCNPLCAQAAMAAAGAELAAADQLAADDPDAPIPFLDTTAVAEVARCVRCGCTEDAACEGGCVWVPNDQMVELCSGCATPQELAAVAWKTTGGRDERGPQGGVL